MAKKKKLTHRKWTDEELQLLKKLFPVKNTKKIAEMLGRTVGSVISKAQMVGLKKVRENKWSNEEIKLLNKLFPIKKTKEVAAKLERPIRSINQKAYILGIKKTSFY